MNLWRAPPLLRLRSGKRSFIVTYFIDNSSDCSLFLSVCVGLPLLLLVLVLLLVAWKVVRILSELLSLVRIISEDIRYMRTHANIDH